MKNMGPGGKTGADAAEGNFRLLAKLLIERKVYRIEDLGQKDYAAYRKLLDELAQSYGKSEDDAERSLEELRKIGALKPKDLRGLKGGTINKHISKQTALVRFMRAEGAKFEPIDFTDLREAQPARGRDLTQSATPRAQQLLFDLVEFTGCAGPEAQFERGNEIYHCANYFVPQLLKYEGARREEICSLMVEEIVFDATIPYIDIRANQYRTLKTLASPRALPIHSEPLRLKFREYCEAIKALGYDLLFPELRWGDATMPLGDRFAKNFQSGLDLIRTTEFAFDAKADEERNLKGAGAPKRRAAQPFRFRQLRKAFNADMKRGGVPLEDRADIMGHAQKTVNEENYTDPTELARMLEIFDKHIPIVTAHLKSRPIQLLPWVRDKLPPPDARTRERRSQMGDRRKRNSSGS
jgi:integrase